MLQATAAAVVKVRGGDRIESARYAAGFELAKPNGGPKDNSTGSRSDRVSPQGPLSTGRGDVQICDPSFAEGPRSGHSAPVELESVRRRRAVWRLRIEGESTRCLVTAVRAALQQWRRSAIRSRPRHRLPSTFALIPAEAAPWSRETPSTKSGLTGRRR